MARPFVQFQWGQKLWALIDKIGDATAIHPKYILPVLSVQWAWGDTADKPNPRNVRAGFFGSAHKESLYYNGIIFFRVMLPFFVGLQVRWGKDVKPSFFQTHIGWKLNGRLAIALRFQSDASAAAGMDFPNPGQAQGWSDGGK